jgi:hypothetical protein
MSHVEAMLDAYPKDLGDIDRAKLASDPWSLAILGR